MNFDIKIKFKAGSKFQEDFGRTSLRTMLQAWLHFMERGHLKNEMSVTINEEKINLTDF